jgi:hypothetical protein
LGELGVQTRQLIPDLQARGLLHRILNCAIDQAVESGVGLIRNALDLLLDEAMHVLGVVGG